MYPEDLLENNTGFSIGYRYPNKFLIEMAYDGDPVASKILPCFYRVSILTITQIVCLSIKMVSFQRLILHLAFVEERALRRQDIVKGY
jgi:hypothetical protein